MFLAGAFLERLRCLARDTRGRLGVAACALLVSCTSDPMTPHSVEIERALDPLQNACDPFRINFSAATDTCYLTRVGGAQRTEWLSEASRMSSGGQGAFCAMVGQNMAAVVDRAYYSKYAPYRQNNAGEWGYEWGSYHPSDDEIHVAWGTNSLNPSRSAADRMNSARHETAHRMGYADEFTARDIAARCGPGGSGYSNGGGGGTGGQEQT